MYGPNHSNHPNLTAASLTPDAGVNACSAGWRGKAEEPAQRARGGGDQPYRAYREAAGDPKTGKFD